MDFLKDQKNLKSCQIGDTMRGVLRFLDMLEVGPLRAPAIEFAADPSLLVSMTASGLHRELLNLPIVCPGHDWSKKFVAALRVFAQWHIDVIAGKAHEGLCAVVGLLAWLRRKGGGLWDSGSVSLGALAPHATPWRCIEPIARGRVWRSVRGSWVVQREGRPTRTSTRTCVTSRPPGGLPVAQRLARSRVPGRPSGGTPNADRD